MSRFAILALCVQVCLIQTVMSQCGCGQPGLASYGLGGLSSQAYISGTNSALNSVSSASCGSYGGQGTGQVGVAGDIGVCGNTVVVGSVPVLGAVDFCGNVPASGSVCISGQCGCGCQA